MGKADLERFKLEDKAQEEAMAIRAAQLTVSGIGEAKQASLIAKEFSHWFTRTDLRNLRKHPKYKEVLANEADDLIASGKLELKIGMKHLVPVLLESLKLAIQEGSVPAMTLVAKGLGIEAETENKQAQSLTVIMPGASPEPKEAAKGFFEAAKKEVCE